MWSRALAYQTISDQRAKVFNLLSTWVRALLSVTNCMNGSCHQHTPDMYEERQIYTVHLKANTLIAIGHEMIFIHTVSTKLSSTS